tara:strand:+ start:35 stop:178 length:144 start_codon:yes stop_codon:yes gene_type:complete
MSDYEEEKIEETYVDMDDQELANELLKELYDETGLKKELNKPNVKQD